MSSGYLGNQDSAVICTQVVAKMRNPETGETVMATDGCEVNTLLDKGWERAPGSGSPPGDLPLTNGSTDDSSNGGSSENGGGTQEAGFSTTPLLVVSGIGAALLFAGDFFSAQSA